MSCFSIIFAKLSHNFLIYIWPILKELIPSVATLLAAYFGAKYAFKFESADKAKQLRNEQISALNGLLFQLFQQLNTIALYKKDFIDPNRNMSTFEFDIPPTLPIDNSTSQFDFSSLNFLLSTKHRQLLLDLYIEQQRFNEAYKSINFRSSLIFEKIQPRYELVQISGNETLDALKIIIGVRLYSHLSKSTEAVISLVDKSVMSLEATKNRVIQIFEELHPESKPLNFELLASTGRNS